MKIKFQSTWTESGEARTIIAYQDSEPYRAYSISPNLTDAEDSVNIHLGALCDYGDWESAAQGVDLFADPVDARALDRFPDHLRSKVFGAPITCVHKAED